MGEETVEPSETSGAAVTVEKQESGPSQEMLDATEMDASSLRSSDSSNDTHPEDSSDGNIKSDIKDEDAKAAVESISEEETRPGAVAVSAADNRNMPLATTVGSHKEEYRSSLPGTAVPSYSSTSKQDELAKKKDANVSDSTSEKEGYKSSFSAATPAGRGGDASIKDSYRGNHTQAAAVAALEEGLEGKPAPPMDEKERARSGRTVQEYGNENQALPGAFMVPGIGAGEEEEPSEAFMDALQQIENQERVESGGTFTTAASNEAGLFDHAAGLSSLTGHSRADSLTGTSSHQGAGVVDVDTLEVEEEESTFAHGADLENQQDYSVPNEEEEGGLVRAQLVEDPSDGRSLASSSRRMNSSRYADDPSVVSGNAEEEGEKILVTAVDVLPEEEEGDHDDPDLDEKGSSTKGSAHSGKEWILENKKLLSIMGCALCLVVVILVIVLSVVLTKDDDENGGSTSSATSQQGQQGVTVTSVLSTRGPTMAPTPSPTISAKPSYAPTLSSSPTMEKFTTTRFNETKVYVLNMILGDWCFHQTYAEKCGGHQASVTTQEEYDHIYELVEKSFRLPRGTWLGGRQIGNTSDTVPGHEGITVAPWVWTDGTEWVEPYPWPRRGDPNNHIVDGVVGEHYILQNLNGIWKDRAACHPEAINLYEPSVYILPEDWRSDPECLAVADNFVDGSTQFGSLEDDVGSSSITLSTNMVSTPFTTIRNGESKVYIYNSVYGDSCQHQELAEQCGGHLASISNERDFSFLEAFKDAMFPIWGRWILYGGVRVANATDPFSRVDKFEWSDGTPWFEGPTYAWDNTWSHWSADEHYYTQGAGWNYMAVGNNMRYRPFAGCNPSVATYYMPAFYILPETWKTDPNCLAISESFVDFHDQTPLRQLPDSIPKKPTLLRDTPYTVTRNNETKVFVLNPTRDYDWCGHEYEFAAKCGGHLASIVNEEEKAYVMSLAFHRWGRIRGFWLGGWQRENTSDTLSVQDGVEEGPWEWVDGTPWTTDIWWNIGQPKNDVSRGVGSHYLILSNWGVQDSNACNSIYNNTHNGGVYLLPVDWMENPECLAVSENFVYF